MVCGVLSFGAMFGSFGDDEEHGTSILGGLVMSMNNVGEA